MKIRRRLRFPTSAVLARGAALLADEFARAGRYGRLDVTRPAAALAHARPRRQHVRPLVLEHRRRVAAREERVAIGVHRLSLSRPTVLPPLPTLLPRTGDSPAALRWEIRCRAAPLGKRPSSSGERGASHLAPFLLHALLNRRSWGRTLERHLRPHFPPCGADACSGAGPPPGAGLGR